MTDSAVLASDPIAVLSDVTVFYGRHRVLDRVSLRLQPGEIYVLLGPNGSGKTSLTKLLTGQLAPEGGTIRLPDDARASVGLVPQDIALYAWLTAGENCRAFARMRGFGVAEARRRALWALDLVGCRAVETMPVHALSGGYKRRVNVAAALVQRPQLLVLDEASVGVDRDARTAIADALAGLRKTGCAILMVTHDMEEAGALADRVGFLHAGRLVGEGEPAGLVTALYGARKEIDIAFSRDPDAAEAGRLADAGLSPSGQRRLWTTRRVLADWDLRPFLAEVETAGCAVDEVRLREPGLPALYAHFCGTALAA